MSNIEASDFDGTRMMTAVAMYLSPRSLLGKLKAIWDATEASVASAEKKHGTVIEKAWRSVVQRESNLAEPPAISINAAKVKTWEDGINVEGNYGNFLLDAYFGAVQTRRDIQAEFRRSVADGGYRGAEDLFMPRNLNHKGFLNCVVPLFFTLQLHCYYLVRDANTPKHTATDPITRQEIARAGGLAKSESQYGESVLKADVTAYLARQKDNSFKSIAALFNSPEREMDQVLTDFKDRIGSPRERGGPPITYGEHLKDNALSTKVVEWAKSDPEFKQILDRVCGRS